MIVADEAPSDRPPTLAWPINSRRSASAWTCSPTHRPTRYSSREQEYRSIPFIPKRLSLYSFAIGTRLDHFIRCTGVLHVRW